MVNRVLKLWTMTAAIVLSFTASASDLMIESRAAPVSPYVQQQVTYTLSLYRKSHLQRGYFLTPEVPDTLIRSLDITPPVYINRSGTEYELIEQRYLLFPQRSGKIELPAPVFSSRDLFIKGDALTLDVRPVPAGESTDNWIVANDLKLTEEWITPDPPWRVGDHLERRITLQGSGVTAAQLAGIALHPHKQLTTHTLNGELQEQLIDSTVHSRRVILLRYIPEKAGEWRLAPMRIRWWHGIENRALDSALPGHTLKILDAPAQAKPRISSAQQAGPTVPEESDKAERGFYPVAAAGGSLILLILIWFLFRLGLSERFTQSLFRLCLCLQITAACMRNSPSEIKLVLHKWAKASKFSDGAFNLISLADQMPQSAMREPLIKLDETLYSGKGIQGWQCKRLHWHLLNLVISTPPTRDTRDPSDLPPLWRE